MEEATGHLSLVGEKGQCTKTGEKCVVKCWRLREGWGLWDPPKPDPLALLTFWAELFSMAGLSCIVRCLATSLVYYPLDASSISKL